MSTSIDTTSDASPWRRYLLAMVWPGVMASSMAIYWLLTGPFQLSFDMALQAHFLILFICIFLLERLFPYHKSWNKYDRQGWNDFIYNITFPAAQLIATLIVVEFLGEQDAGNKNLMGIEIPFFVQFVILILIVDLIWYVYHRAFHSVPVLWKLHALHHNSQQLHVLNNARVHPLEVFALFLPIMLVVQFIHAPIVVLNWYFAFQLTVGLLTHSNVAVNSGWLSWIFNTPELHHWHHSRVRREHDNNYGSVSMFWDHLFGTYHNPRDRHALEDIGVNTPVPTGWFGQLIIPLRRLPTERDNLNQAAHGNTPNQP